MRDVDDRQLPLLWGCSVKPRLGLCAAASVYMTRTNGFGFFVPEFPRVEQITKSSNFVTPVGPGFANLLLLVGLATRTWITAALAFALANVTTWRRY